MDDHTSLPHAVPSLSIIPIPTTGSTPPLDATRSSRPKTPVVDDHCSDEGDADLQGAGNRHGDASRSEQPVGDDSSDEDVPKWVIFFTMESLLAMLGRALTQDMCAGNGMSLDVAIAFRVKALTLMVCEVCISLIAAVVTDFSYKGKPMLATMLIASCTSAGTLIVAYVLKYRYPWNYLLCIFLAASTGVTVGLTPEFFQPEAEPLFALHESLSSPCQACLCLYIVGLCVVAVAARPKLSGERTLRTVAAATIVALVIAAITFAIWASTQAFSLARWCGVISVVALCLVWAGYDIDKLTTKLNPDDYLLPCILVWFDLFVVTTMASFALVASFLACAVMSGNSASACECKSYKCCCCLCTSSDWFHFEETANREVASVEQMSMPEENP